MAEKTSHSSKFLVSKRTEIPGYEKLETLALNLIWSWSHKADRIWRHLDPVLWDITSNPWAVLQTVSIEKLNAVLSDPEFRKIVDDLIALNQLHETNLGWFQKEHPQSPLSCIAYFSMEFMLSEALPIYSGGLGNVAGDQLKAASDLGVPVVAVGLLYQQGYFRQVIDKEGRQQAFYPYNDPGQLPITPLRKPNGEWLRLEIPFPGWTLWIRAWHVKVGSTLLLLLDTNDCANLPVYRGITNELYGGGAEQRIQQELVLGIGGWRLLDTLGFKPEVCHLNEGHAAFAILERARCLMQEQQLSFEVSLNATRAGNVFTTHTAVTAGFDRFSPALMEQYLGRYARLRLNITIEELLALGRENPQDPNESFNMAYLAMRGSGAVNGVSRLHGQVSRELFAHLFPQWPENEVPIDYITNGIHVPSWDSAGADKLWAEACGESRWLGETEDLKRAIRQVSSEKIWTMRSAGRSTLINYARERLARQLAGQGAAIDYVEQARVIFDPNILTLGFARRFATYKRANLLLHDPERLTRILTNPNFPVQLILAGKAHPADKPGQDIILEWMNFLKKPEIRSRVIFLSDYDMLLTEKMVQGVDVWINTPRRPWEACGTSGMKVLVNGGLNCSELDGWWEEAYAPELGWAIGDGLEHPQDPTKDAEDAKALYEILEEQIIPEFYACNEQQYPEAWIAKIRESMARLTPYYSANRAVRDYTEKYYIPAAKAYSERIANQSKLSQQLVIAKNAITKEWGTCSVKMLQVNTSELMHQFIAEVNFGSLDPTFVQVQLHADKNSSYPTECFLMQLEGNLAPEATFKLTISAQRPAEEYTARLIPFMQYLNIPLELNQILWAK